MRCFRSFEDLDKSVSSHSATYGDEVLHLLNGRLCVLLRFLQQIRLTVKESEVVREMIDRFVKLLSTQAVLFQDFADILTQLVRIGFDFHQLNEILRPKKINGLSHRCVQHISVLDQRLAAMDDLKESRLVDVRPGRNSDVLLPERRHSVEITSVKPLTRRRLEAKQNERISGETTFD